MSKGEKPYDVAVFIGRFQPFHNGHLKVVMDAVTKKADKLIILVGSSNIARDTRNPFTYEERVALILDVLAGHAAKIVADTSGDPDHVTAWRRKFFESVVVCPLPDSPYDLQEWIENVQHVVRQASAPALRPRICLVGHERDHTSYYLKLFPQWTYEPAGDASGIEATHLREDYFRGGVNFHASEWRDSGPIWPQVCPPETIRFLDSFRGSKAYGRLMDDRRAELDYKAEWGGKEPHVTVDSVVVQSGHVLVVRRGGRYGTDMLAMPGGFLEVDRKETLLQGACRETFEETKLYAHISEDVTDEHRHRALYTHLRGRDVFDDPNRSRRGRLITHAFLFKLPDDFRLPPVEGSDDAKEAFWLPISEVRADEFFEDHAFIVEKMIRQFL